MTSEPGCGQSWGILFWHADVPPPPGAFACCWTPARPGAPAAYVAFRDVDDVDAVGGPGTPWAQIYPAHRLFPPAATPTALLVVRSRCTPALDEAEFNAWYDTDHLPPLAASPACLRVRRFHRAGEEYPYLAIYEITDWAAWEATPARAQVRASAWAKRVVPLFERTEGYYVPVSAAAATDGGDGR
jgi:hypothetical protein